jgi:hypothetical protein
MYYQPNSWNKHAEHEWVGGNFLRQLKKVPLAHAQRVYLEERMVVREAHTGYTRCAWAGETFFPVVLLCQFLVSGGK